MVPYPGPLADTAALFTLINMPSLVLLSTLSIDAGKAEVIADGFPPDRPFMLRSFTAAAFILADPSVFRRTEWSDIPAAAA